MITKENQTTEVCFVKRFNPIANKHIKSSFDRDENLENEIKIVTNLERIEAVCAIILIAVAR